MSTELSGVYRTLGRYRRQGRVSRALRAAAILVCAGLLAACAAGPGKAKSGQFSSFSNRPPATKPPDDEPSTDRKAALLKADLALQSGDRDEALFLYIKVLEMDPKDARALTKIGQIHREKGNLNLAEAAYGMALQLAPGNPETLEGLGLIELQTRRPEAARKSLLAAATADKTRWRALNALGLLADLDGTPAAAAGYFRRALNIRPDDSALLNNAGYSRYLAGDFPEALRYFEAALKSDEKYAPAWLNKGLILARQGKDTAALEAFRHILDTADSYNDLGYIRLMEGNNAAARNYLEQALSDSPTFHRQASENLKLLEAKGY